jgi:hypothetical protein
MISKKELISIIFIFIIIYLILYLDYRLNNTTNDEKKYISIKIPSFISILSFIFYKLFNKQITYYFKNSIIKQDIITEMADF